MKEIRLGTIGSGFIVCNILEQVEKVDGISLEAVYSRTMENGQKIAQRFGSEKIYTNLEDLFADEKVNVIYIASPNSIHYQQIKAALLAGKNVICEKPFVPEKKKAEELIALAKEKNLLLIDATPTYYLPNLPLLKKQLSKIGRIRMVMGNYSQYSSRYDALKAGELPNVFNPDYAGGCLMDINYYNIYLNIALFGKPEQVSYIANLYNGMIDTSGVVNLQYKDFISTQVGAKDTWGVNYFQIEGEQGYIYIKDGGNVLTEIQVVTKDSQESFNIQDNSNRWFYFVENVTKMILDEDEDKITKNQQYMLNTIGIIDEIRKGE